MLDLLAKLRPGVTVHGFRASFSTWCTEQTSFPTEVREMALAHAVGSTVEQAYRRTDLFEKRRALADAWASYVNGEPSEGNVIQLPLREAAAQ
jgi:integrase